VVHPAVRRGVEARPLSAISGHSRTRAPIDGHSPQAWSTGVSEVSLHDVEARSATLEILLSFFA
jgi:hypothetical protein